MTRRLTYSWRDFWFGNPSTVCPSPVYLHCRNGCAKKHTAAQLDRTEQPDKKGFLTESIFGLFESKSSAIYTMRLIAVNRFVGSNWYRRPRKRPLVGPTGSPFLDILVMQTRACRWFRKNKSVNPLKQVTFRKYDRVLYARPFWYGFVLGSL